MAKWFEFTKKVGRGRIKVSYGKKRFYSSRDMSELKRLESIANARSKRKEADKKHDFITECGCGIEGCFILSH